MVFANPLMGSAAMDRLVHRATKIVIEGKSYRVDAFIQRPKRLTGEEEPQRSPAATASPTGSRGKEVRNEPD